MRPRLVLPDSAFLRQNAPWLAAATLLMMMSSFGQTFFIAIFAGELRAEFGLSNGYWGGIYTLATTASALAMVWVGGITDRLRARVLGAFVLASLATACLVMASVSAVWMLVVAVFLLRFFGQGMCSQVAMVATARWFVASRGKALAVASLGVATGEALLPLGFVALKGMTDWRLLWVLAASVLLCMIPLLWLLLRHERTPQSMATESTSTGLERRHWRRTEVLKHWLFWAMVPAMLGPAAFNTAFFFHQVHYADSIGIAHLTLVAMFPLFTATGILTMLGAGVAVDRLGSGAVATVYLVPAALAYAVLGWGGSVAMLAAGLVLAGATAGMNSTLTAAVWAEYFGTRYLGEIRAMVAAVTVLGTALGPGITGLLLDLGLGFQTQLYGVALYFALSGGLAALAFARARPLLRAAQPDVERA